MDSESKRFGKFSPTPSLTRLIWTPSCQLGDACYSAAVYLAGHGLAPLLIAAISIVWFLLKSSSMNQGYSLIFPEENPDLNQQRALWVETRRK